MLKKLFSIFLYLLLIGSAALLFLTLRYPEIEIYVQSVFGMAPCQKPIKYSFGSIDEQFKISDEEILSAMQDAEKIWEKEAGKELFAYADGGKLKVNFIYDSRQMATDKLKNLGIKIDTTAESYENLKSELEIRKTRFEKDERTLNSLIENIDSAKTKYEADVKYWNEKGGAPKNEYERLSAERARIEELLAQANQEGGVLEMKIDEINSLVDAVNSVARDINLNVETYNRIGRSNGEEFDEGIYRSDWFGKVIEIYQFRDRTQLVRVLAHELGHALDLEHVENDKSIMYELNQSTNVAPTAEDIVELKRVCRF